MHMRKTTAAFITNSIAPKFIFLRKRTGWTIRMAWFITMAFIIYSSVLSRWFSLGTDALGTCNKRRFNSLAGTTCCFIPWQHWLYFFWQRRYRQQQHFGFWYKWKSAIGAVFTQHDTVGEKKKTIFFKTKALLTVMMMVKHGLSMHIILFYKIRVFQIFVILR